MDTFFVYEVCFLRLLGVKNSSQFGHRQYTLFEGFVDNIFEFKNREKLHIFDFKSTEHFDWLYKCSLKKK